MDEIVLKNVDNYGGLRDGLLQVTSIVLKLKLLKAVYFEAVKLLLNRFSFWENCDIYNYISNSSDSSVWENCLTDAA